MHLLQFDANCISTKPENFPIAKCEYLTVVAMNITAAIYSKVNFIAVPNSKNVKLDN